MFMSKRIYDSLRPNGYKNRNVAVNSRDIVTQTITFTV